MVDTHRDDESDAKNDSQNNSFASREHVYKNRGFYAFRYVVMLLSGAGFLSCLLSVISLTVKKLVNSDDFSTSLWMASYMGPLYANLVTAVIILGIAHLFLSLTVGKNWKPEDGEKRKYPVVLSVIYSVGIGVAIMSFLVFFMGTLVGSMLGLNDAKGTDVLEQFLTSLISILVLGFALVYKLNLLKTVAKTVYIMVMGVFAFVWVVLFLAFPAGEIRDMIYDSNTVKDLNVIEDKVEVYYNKKNSLPTSLSDLEFEKDELKYGLKNYTYKVVSSGERSRYSYNYYNYSSEYEICVEFKTDTTEDYSGIYDDEDEYGSYYYHKKGNRCFKRSVRSYDPIYKYDDYDYDDYDIDDDEDDDDDDEILFDWDWLDDDNEDDDDE